MCGLLVKPQHIRFGTQIWQQSMKMSKIGQKSMKKWPFLPPSCHEWQIMDPKEVFLRLFGANLPWLLYVGLVINVIFFTEEMLHIG